MKKLIKFLLVFRNLDQFYVFTELRDIFGEFDF